jgi:hypothetical protein
MSLQILKWKNKFGWQNALHFYRDPTFIFIVTKCIGYEYNQGETYGSSNVYSIIHIRLVKSK